MSVFRAIAVGATAVLACAQAQAQIYSMGANPQGSVFYNASAAVAKVASDKLKMQLRVQPMAGSSTYIPLLNKGELDFGLTNVDDTLSSFKGTGNFEGKPNPDLRIMTLLFPLSLGVLVPADSPAKTIKDVKGLRLPSGYVGQTTLRVMQGALLASAGLTMKDVKEYPVVNAFQGTDALGAGKVDAAVIGPGAAQIQKAHAELVSRGGVRFLPVEATPDTLAAMRRFAPVRTMVFQPAPHYPGVIGPTTLMTYSIYLSTNAKVADEVVYQMVKTLSESRADLMKITPILSGFDPKAMTEKIEVPWHPGAIKFYTEIGQWPPTS